MDIEEVNVRILCKETFHLIVEQPIVVALLRERVIINRMCNNALLSVFQLRWMTQGAVVSRKFSATDDARNVITGCVRRPEG